MDEGFYLPAGRNAKRLAGATHNVRVPSSCHSARPEQEMLEYPAGWWSPLVWTLGHQKEIFRERDYSYSLS